MQCTVCIRLVSRRETISNRNSLYSMWKNKEIKRIKKIKKKKRSIRNALRKYRSRNGSQYQISTKSTKLTFAISYTSHPVHPVRLCLQNSRAVNYRLALVHYNWMSDRRAMLAGYIETDRNNGLPWMGEGKGSHVWSNLEHQYLR